MNEPRISIYELYAGIANVHSEPTNFHQLIVVSNLQYLREWTKNYLLKNVVSINEEECSHLTEEVVNELLSHGDKIPILVAYLRMSRPFLYFLYSKRVIQEREDLYHFAPDKYGNYIYKEGEYNDFYYPFYMFVVKRYV